LRGARGTLSALITEDILVVQGKVCYTKCLTHMKRNSSGSTGHRHLILAASVCLLMAEMPARAYTDPGSGALLWQVLVAGFVGGLFYFRKLLDWLRKKMKGAGG
jgi:hypothetical protein